MKASNARGQRISGTKLEQTLERVQYSQTMAIRLGQTARANELQAQIDELRAEIAKRREAAKARSEKRSAEAKDAWFRQQLALAQAGLLK